VIRKSYLLILTSLLILVSCIKNYGDQIILSEPRLTPIYNKLPSASGIAVSNHSIYIVGDDSPWLYQLDRDLIIIEKTRLSSIDSIINGRTPKKLKADFECAELLISDTLEELVVISSGSSPISRDTAYILVPEDHTTLISKNIRPLYESIKFVSKIDSINEINIEGITFSDTHAYLFHRGNVSENIIIRIPLNNFINYLKKKEQQVPDFDIFNFNLPEYNGIKSGFSGACMLPDNSGIIFTASMEDTNDEVSDGKVLGSYIGIIPLAKLNEGQYVVSLLKKGGSPLEKKLEGIEIINSDKTLQMISVCDNDDGTSDIIQFELKFY
jgi:uncharacterized protein DUF6929